MASHVHPQSAVRLFSGSATQHGFAMEFISGDDDYLWKTAILDGWIDAYPIASVEDPLGEDHRDCMIEFPRSERMAKWNECLRIHDSMEA